MGKISYSAVTKVCQWLDNRGFSALADELYRSEVKREFRYLLSLYSSDRHKFIVPGKKITVYRDGEPFPSVLWSLNPSWRDNLTSYEDTGEIDERVISSNFQHFIK
ncbi:hypothetical protein [Myxosarcina sp. GI1]|uniref:hypothetical protein n=1 Tax=Myxosarcina sp. GI1 TaxID=1541065 RepID=UPI000564622D|nr:hypothetical protein [Myxosarcina sp. GI1]